MCRVMARVQQKAKPLIKLRKTRATQRQWDPRTAPISARSTVMAYNPAAGTSLPGPFPRATSKIKRPNVAVGARQRRGGLGTKPTQGGAACEATRHAGLEPTPAGGAVRFAELAAPSGRLDASQTQDQGLQDEEESQGRAACR
jgi:hypothetical protein